MSTRAAVIVLHKKLCEIMEVQYGYDLAENWLSGSVSPMQLDAMRTRAKELSTIPLSDGGLWEYYYEVTDEATVQELNALGTDWLSSNLDCEILIFLRQGNDTDYYDMYIHRTLWADDNEIEPDVRCLGS